MADIKITKNGKSLNNIGTWVIQGDQRLSAGDIAIHREPKKDKISTEAYGLIISVGDVVKIQLYSFTGDAVITKIDGDDTLIYRILL